MSTAARKLRVLIPTTAGTVEILLLTEEDPAIGRSVACIGGTTEIADIAASYHAFVARPTGVVERLFGHSCYRLDVSGRIDAGSSWQLGVLAAHALCAAGRLAQEKDTAEGVIWATGSVRPVDLTVSSVSHVQEKLANSLGRLKQEASAGRAVLAAIPAQNAEALGAAVRADLEAHGIEVMTLADVQSLWSRLAIKLPELPSPAARPPGEAPVTLSSTRKRRGWVPVVVAAAIASVVLGAGAFYSLLQLPAPSTDVINPPSLSAQSPPQVQKEAEVLVPETVPFASDRDRINIRTAYLAAPDFKALALSSSTMGFATHQPDEETARAAAMAACQRVMNEQRVNSRCELYALGLRVVSDRGRPPLPPPPWITRNPKIEAPFVAGDVPLVSDDTRQILAGPSSYAKGRKPKALAVSSTGFYSPYTGQASSDEAVRRALERCGSNSGAACLVVALDDTFVVPIPRSMKPLGLFQASTASAIAPELRDNVARRVGNAAGGWNAVAAGAGGNVGLNLGADTEQAAVDGALADCNARDRTCRVVAIGPFLVDAPPPAAPKPAGEAKLRELIAALTSALPGRPAESRETLAQSYLAMTEHKALAIVPGMDRPFRSSGWATPEEAEEGALERCQVYHGYPCATALIDDKAAPAGGKSSRDMARARYSGTFDPGRIPGVLPGVRMRPDIVGYQNAPSPKAAAYHPWGRVFTVTSATTQRAAETRALADCNADPVRQGQDGPCHLYAAGNQVVLPQRLTDPSTR
jgi:hypothetical protein